MLQGHGWTDVHLRSTLSSLDGIGRILGVMPYELSFSTEFHLQFQAIGEEDMTPAAFLRQLEKILILQCPSAVLPGVE